VEEGLQDAGLIRKVTQERFWTNSWKKNPWITVKYNALLVASFQFEISPFEACDIDCCQNQGKIPAI